MTKPMKLIGAATILLILTQQMLAQSPTVDFNNDIRPILADTCYKCHGPDEHERAADLRLDTKDGLFDSESVVPNDLDASELYQRITSDDEDTLMPPPDSGRVLSEEQKHLLMLWIQQGANWAQHWSLEAPQKSELPDVTDKSWPTNPIDYFIADRVTKAGMIQTKPASRQTLIRRVTFDLTGLPPSMDLMQRYTTTGSGNWYEQLVDELLGSEHYGEHMARYWLDAARYGDTHGLHLDNYREMWPYRDWVVNAFNDNKSYRDFTIEQLAGDMLENPTQQQLIGSGFNRAHVTTNEGGSIEEEVYVRNVVDRVSTTGTVFLGMTVGCAQCHDHKFDPISQKEFYQLFAYFNNMTDPPMDKNIKDPQPVMKVLGEVEKTQLAKLQSDVAAANKALTDAVAKIKYVDPADSEEVKVHNDEEKPKAARDFVWVEDQTLPTGAKKEQKWKYVSHKDGKVHTGTYARLQRTGAGMVQHFFTGAVSPLKAKLGDKLFAHVWLDPKNPPEQVMLQFNNGNWEHRVYWGKDAIQWGQNGSPSRYHAGDLPKTGEWVRLEIEAEKVGFKDPSLINGVAFTQSGGKAYWDSAGIHSSTNQTTEFKSLKKWIAASRESKGVGLPDDIKKLINQAPDKLGKPGNEKLRKHFVIKVLPDHRVKFEELTKNQQQAKSELDKFNKTIPTTLISKENANVKDAFMLNRGEYDQKGDKVERKTPAALPPLGDRPNNRLGLAQWLTSPEHPLTARVAVNRFWQQLFGTGIVKTSEDFGSQGEMPTHPELLDWLAVDFVESGWDVKRLMKLMVMSSTYRQSSLVSKQSLELDPENRLYARGPRFRLDAEMLRDQALAVSGLLVPSLGGPSVKPPQPDGLWFAVGYSGSNTVRFKKDSGHVKVHRRSIYTFWKRTAPPPQMNTFDAPSREECRVRRERTNTPLQALLLMNDPQYVEAARYFALSTFEETLENDSQIINWMFNKAIGRDALQNELAIIQKDLNSYRFAFEANPEDARKLISIGEQPPEGQLLESKTKLTELASLTMIANLIMNMDEFVTKN